MILQLAPMEGVVDPVIRDIYTKLGGYQLCTTEFIRVSNQLIPNKVFYRYCPELYRGGKTRAGVPVFVQLLGSSPEYLLANAETAVRLGALGIDMNFGCPAKTVNKHDGGASLLKDPSRIYKIISHLRQGLPAHIPVTAKVRLGFEDKSKCIEIAKAVEDGGASFIGIHARTKKEAYKPPAHWEYIAMMRENINIPVLANGDIWSVEDWKRCKEVSGCKDFLLGRGAFAFPQLANEIYATNDFSEELSPVEKAIPFIQRTQSKMNSKNNWDDTLSTYMDFLKISLETYGANYAGKRGKQWLKFLGNTYPQAAEHFDATKRFKDFKDIITYYKDKQMDNKSLGLM